MSAKRLGITFLWIWLGAVVLELLCILVFEVELPLPSGIFFLGIFIPALYDWTRSKTLHEDRQLFLLELADMLRLGVPLSEAVSRLQQHREGDFGSKYSGFTTSVAPLKHRLDSGDSLPEALTGLKDVPPAWSTFLANVQHSEDLPRALEDLAKNEGPRLPIPLLTMLRLQLMVPLLFGITAFLCIYILPTFQQLFVGMELQLPFPTRVLLSVNQASRSILFLPLSLLGLLILLSIASQRVRNWIWRLVYYVPGLKRLVSLECQARVYQLLASGLRLGAPQEDCLAEASRAMEIKAYREALSDLSSKQSSTLVEGLSSHPELFGDSFRWILEQGELSESLPEALLTASELAGTQLQQLARRLVVNLDTVILALLGLVMGYSILGVWLPLYQLIGNLG